MISFFYRAKFGIVNRISEIPFLHRRLENWRQRRGYVTDADLDEHNRWADATCKIANTAMHREDGFLKTPGAEEVYDLAEESGASVSADYASDGNMVAYFPFEIRHPDDIENMTDGEVLAHTGGLEMHPTSADVPVKIKELADRVQKLGGNARIVDGLEDGFAVFIQMGEKAYNYA